MIEMKKTEVLDIELELSTLCNADCPLCFRNYDTFKEHYPNTLIRPLNEIITQLEEYDNLEYIRLVGSISEPTLYKYFFELVKYIKSRNIKIEICTNGDTNSPEWWHKLNVILNEEDRVYFTICGSTQELHEIYRSNTTLSKIIDNVIGFQKGNNKIDYAQCIRFEYNSDNFDTEEFKKFVSVFNNIYMTETFLSKDSSNYINKKNLDLLKPNKKKQEQYFNIEKIANIGLSKKTLCKSWENKSQQVDINGNVYPCYLFLEASIGKLWDQDYEKIHNLEYDVCKFCEKNVMKMCMEKGLEYII